MLRFREHLYSALLILLGLTMAVSVVELGLKQYRRLIKSSEHMDPGLMVYDPELGWTLSANWKGRHHHYNDDITYTTDALGFRNDWPVDPLGLESRWAVLGDSYVFGLGANDGETFVHQFNEMHSGNPVFANLGVPGYSTDQEYLLLKRRILASHPVGVTAVRLPRQRYI